MKDPNGIFIERGSIEDLTIKITDNAAVFYFKDPKVTRKFADFEINANKKYNKPATTSFSLRTQKAITMYEGKSKEEIRDIILDQLKQLGVNIKESGK
jgi:hypothetical protein